MTDRVPPGSNAPHLFLAVATGQGVANLPPILEVGDAARRDAILWLESHEAKQRGWSAAPSEVLKARGFTILDGSLLPEEPAAASMAMQQILARPDLAEFRKILVANGGKKTTSLALAAAARDGGPLPLLYGEDQPCELWSMPEGIAGPLERLRYARSRLTLQEILACSDRIISTPATANRFWPSNEPLADERYGIDPEMTGNLHETTTRQRAEGNALRQRETGEAIDFANILTARPDAVEKWMKTVWTSSVALARREPMPPTDWRAFGHRNRAELQGLFRGAQNTASRYLTDLERPVPREAGQRIGQRFEQAVGRRVQSWLNAKADVLPVNEAWMNVATTRRDGTGRRLQELDIVLVLANGVLLALECKSFEVETKDIDARVINLHRSGSQLARMAVCMPLYVDLAHKDWFRDQHDRYERYRSAFRIIPFTLPGQSRTYIIAPSGGLNDQTATTDDEERPPVPVPITKELASFEESLDNWIRPYVREH